MSLEDLETINFPKMYSDDFYESWHSFKLIHSTVFVQFRKIRARGRVFPLPRSINSAVTFSSRSVALQSFCSWMNPRLLSANDVMFSCVLFGKWADTAVLCEIYPKL